MLRDPLFQSGVPLMIATITSLSLAYLAVVRRERFLGHWTAAWVVLMARFGWAMGHAWMSATWIGVGQGALRLAFCFALLAGVIELRGRRVKATTVIGASLVSTALLIVSEMLLNGIISSQIIRTVVAAGVTTAAWLLASHASLPIVERRATALALVAYAVLAWILPWMSDSSPWFIRLSVLSWGFQISIGLTMMAMFFRASYGAELAAQQKVDKELTQALSDFLPVCAWCKSIRDEKETWMTLEAYLHTRTDLHVSHGICPSCTAKVWHEDGLGPPPAADGHD